MENISSQTVQRLLQACRLKLWRVHHWLSAKVPRDDVFRQQVLTVCDLYTREVNETARILLLDE